VPAVEAKTGDFSPREASRRFASNRPVRPGESGKSRLPLLDLSFFLLPS